MSKVKTALVSSALMAAILGAAKVIKAETPSTDAQINAMEAFKKAGKESGASDVALEALVKSAKESKMSDIDLVVALHRAEHNTPMSSEMDGLMASLLGGEFDDNDDDSEDVEEGD